MLAVGGQIGRKRRGGVEHLDVAGALVERALEQLGQSAEVVRAEHDIEMRERLEKLVAVALPDAAADGDDALVEWGARAQRDVLHRGDLAVQACVGSLAHAARHEDDDIGILELLDRKGAERLEHAVDALGIVLVHLTPERADAKH